MFQVFIKRVAAIMRGETKHGAPMSYFSPHLDAMPLEYAFFGCLHAPFLLFFLGKLARLVSELSPITRTILSNLAQWPSNSSFGVIH